VVFDFSTEAKTKAIAFSPKLLVVLGGPLVFFFPRVGPPPPPGGAVLSLSGFFGLWRTQKTGCGVPPQQGPPKFFFFCRGVWGAGPHHKTSFGFYPPSPRFGVFWAKNPLGWWGAWGVGVGGFGLLNKKPLKKQTATKSCCALGFF